MLEAGTVKGKDLEKLHMCFAWREMDGGSVQSDRWLMQSRWVCFHAVSVKKRR